MENKKNVKMLVFGLVLVMGGVLAFGLSGLDAEDSEGRYRRALRSPRAVEQPTRRALPRAVRTVERESTRRSPERSSGNSMQFGTIENPTRSLPSVKRPAGNNNLASIDYDPTAVNATFTSYADGVGDGDFFIGWPANDIYLASIHNYSDPAALHCPEHELPLGQWKLSTNTPLEMSQLDVTVSGYGKMNNLRLAVGSTPGGADLAEYNKAPAAYYDSFVASDFNVDNIIEAPAGDTYVTLYGTVFVEEDHESGGTSINNSELRFGYSYNANFVYGTNVYGQDLEIPADGSNFDVANTMHHGDRFRTDFKRNNSEYGCLLP